MVNCMLQYYPEAASNVFNGYRGQYTALHSAVFHGRCSSTIELLLNAEKKASSDENASSKACLLGNTQGELPLHFCAMRGEPPRTVALLAKAAPEAIFQRDTSGLTPV
jgi:ankyrin repeat protein